MKKQHLQTILRHLLGMESLNRKTIYTIFKKASHFLHTCIEKDSILNVMHGKLVANLFFEPSTRTRNSFEIAAKRLGALVISPNIDISSTVKGESLIDTIHTFECLGTSIFIIRHTDNYIPQKVASLLSGDASVINAGDGNHQHPTQALSDLFTISQYKSDFTSLRVALIGDIAHSRVARSLIMGLSMMGTSDIRLIAPIALIPPAKDEFAGTVFHTIEEGLQEVDVIVTLRIQQERMTIDEVPDKNNFFANYGLTEQRLTLAKKDAIVMHPGPINRNVEIASVITDSPQSVIRQQVRNGLAIRMAVIESLFH